MTILPEILPARQRIARIALGDLIHRAANRFSERPAIFHDEGVVTFAQMNAQSNRFAHFLIGQGLREGAHVGMLCANSVEMVYAFLGIQKAGLVWVPINTGLAPDAIEPASMDDLQAEVASYEAVLQQLIRELVDHARNGEPFAKSNA